MSIENILKRIEEEAESTAQELLDKAKAEAAQIDDDYSEKAKELKEKLGARAKSGAAEEERRLVVSEQLELKKALLTKKREILAELYKEARSRIESLPEKEYLKLLKALILEKAISGREEIIIPSGQGDIISQDFLVSLNKDFPGGGGFSIAKEPGEFSWGVVLREGRRVVDLSLEVLFDQLKERIEPEIAEVLFSGQQ
jgi:V/A-type H+-transporting ATPase subunit E